MGMLSQNVPDLVAHINKIRAGAEWLENRSYERPGDVWKKVPHANVHFARLKIVAEELVSVKSKLAFICEECVNSGWSARTNAMGAFKLEKNVSIALMTVFGKATDAT